MTYLLHIDTSAETGTVAIGADGNLVATSITTDARNYASVLNNMIDEVLKKAGIRLQDLSGIAICSGPGSYTGLRIGMATAKALCYVLDKPLLSHNKLTLLADQTYHAEKIKYDFYTVLIPAREKEYYITIHDSKSHCILSPQHIFEDQLSAVIEANTRTCLIVGTTEFLPNTLLTSDIHIVINDKINLENWCRYAFKGLKCNETVILSSAEPSYLKEVYTHK
jgi:tRNA threonylcarbamoyladenosine biosynthesis protein TsaB